MKISKLAILVLISALFSQNLVSQDLYDINHITILELTFEETNWDEILDQYFAAGNDERLLAKAVINGIEFDSVGVRYKGNSTYHANNGKNPFNIKLNYMIDQDYQGFEKLKLANGNHDPSFLREVLSYEIARKYMVAPLSNYTKVYVNGSYHGLYNSSESINGDFGQRYLFADGNNTRIKGNSDITGPEGISSLNYLGPDSTAYYTHYELKSDYGWMDMVELTDALENNPEDIESLLDIDKAIWMLAFNNVMVNLDSYSGRQANFYLIKDDNSIFDLILWDLNMSLGGFETIGGGPPAPGNLNDLIELSPLQEEGNSAYPLIKLVLENDVYKKMYIAHCRTILEENIVNGWYETRAGELQGFITDAYQTDPNAFYSFSSFINNMTVTVPSSGPPPNGSKGAFGITQLFDARVNFLQNHTEYQYAPPAISDIVVTPDVVPEYSTATITTSVINSNAVFLAYRHQLSDKFLKTDMFDDGNHNDGTAGDGVYGVEISVGSTDIQYYIYAANDDAGMFSPERAAHEFFQIEVIATISDVAINEFMADNESTVADPDGEYDDWIELFNNTSGAISLAGYYLSDDAENLIKWEFPETSIEAESFLIVWADNDEGQEGLHANFKLSGNGEQLYLTSPDGISILDQVIFGAQTTDKTTGRYPNGTGDFSEMFPTFNAENEISSGLPGFVGNDIEVQIYPNPASDWLKIEINKEKSFQFEVYNCFGSLIHKGIVEKETTLRISDWPSGLYVMNIRGRGYRILVSR